MDHDKYDSPIGPLWLTGHDGVLTGLSFSGPDDDLTSVGFDAVKHWLDDYFRGLSREVDFPMDPSGTTFQKLIWGLLMKIPYGKTVTYGDLARQAAASMGKEKMSSQAAGQAAGRNPIAIIIPCHRVIGAGGKLTGYAWGNEKKQWLLEHEQQEKIP